MNRGQIEDIINQRLADLKREIKEELSVEFAGLRSTRKNSSGHKKAGESWERSPKGSKWKAELEAAKEELKRIIAERTGKDEYANQQLVTKYASAKRKGGVEEMNRIVEDVIANARGEAVMIAPAAAQNSTRRNRNNRSKAVNANMNRLMNSTFAALPQKPVTPVPAPAPVILQKPVEEPNEFNLTEPFTYGEY